MSVEFVVSLCEPGIVADGKTVSSFDGFRIGRGGVVWRRRKRLLNTHFVTRGLARKTAETNAEDRMATGSEDRSRPRLLGLGGLGLTQNDQPAHRMMRSDTKQ